MNGVDVLICNDVIVVFRLCMPAEVLSQLKHCHHIL